MPATNPRAGPGASTRIFIQYDGSKLTIPELAARLAMSQSTLRWRLRGHPVEIACQRSTRHPYNGYGHRTSGAGEVDYRLSVYNAEKPPRTVLGEWLQLQRGTHRQPFRPVHPVQKAQLRELERLWEA